MRTTSFCMEKKICKSCGIQKDLDQFSFRNKSHGKRRADCKVCFGKLRQNHYQLHKKIYKKRSRDRSRALALENLSLVRELKAKTPCTDCGHNYPYYVMDFDHKDRAQKKFLLSSLSRSRNTTRTTLLKEIAKCDIVCANCHRKRTYAHLSPS